MIFNVIIKKPSVIELIKPTPNLIIILKDIEYYWNRSPLSEGEEYFKLFSGPSPEDEDVRFLGKTFPYYIKPCASIIKSISYSKYKYAIIGNGLYVKTNGLSHLSIDIIAETILFPGK